jgi:outer membrane protein assembly factor BamB
VGHADGRDQLITCADPWVIAYNPADGRQEYWRAKVLRQDVGPSPTFADGLVYVANQFPYLSAIKPDGSGDVTKSQVVFTAEDGLPDTCSPLATSQFVFLLTSDGLLTCYDAKSGEKLWEHDFDGLPFSSSPGLVGKLVYLVSKEGKSFVIEPTREGCKIVAEGNLGENCVTSPAFQDGRIYLRGQKHLFCIEENK